MIKGKRKNRLLREEPKKICGVKRKRKTNVKSRAQANWRENLRFFLSLRAFFMSFAKF